MSDLIELPPNHYRVNVSYKPMPSFDDLEDEFGKKNVSVIFDGREWTLHSSCVGMSRVPGNRIFHVHDVGRDWEREDWIALGLARRSAVAPCGYRPVTHEETYEFSKAHPELADYVGLGSSTSHNDSECIAFVWSFCGQRKLGNCWFVGGIDARNRVLSVAITEDDLRGMRK